jgi:hypothetical protein
LWEAVFKGDALINLVEEISRQPAFRLWHRYGWMLLGKFKLKSMTKIKSRNARKTCSLPRKEAQVKLGPRKV